MRLYDQSIIDQFGKAKEYHFLNMHVYVNGLFRDDKVAEKEHVYSHYDAKPAYFSKDHRVHIYLWRLNTDLENIIEMFKFIGEVNKIVLKPVYIHMPKRILHENPFLIKDLKAILDGMEYEGNKLCYELIVEKNSNVTEFKYGDYIPIEGMKWGSTRFPDAKLLVSWDPHGYARPTFYNGKTESPVFDR